MRNVASLLVGVLLLAACGDDRPSLDEFGGATMGTTFKIKLPALPAEIDVAALQDEVEALLLATEQQMSTYRIDSEVSRFNISRSTEWQPVSMEFCRAAEQSLEFSRTSAGAFDITVGPLVNLWGFGPDGSTLNAPAEAEIETVRARVGYQHLQADCSVPALRKNMAALYLDLSGYAKGLAVDRVADLLDDKQVPNYLVEIGGEMKLKGRNRAGRRWAVAIEEPLTGERRVHSVIRLTDQAVATSGDYRNFFESGGVQYSHLIDARTGRPVAHNLASVTVIAEAAAFADAMATALLALGPDDGMRLAISENIATLFLVRGQAGIDERMSPAFAALGVTE